MCTDPHDSQVTLVGWRPELTGFEEEVDAPGGPACAAVAIVQKPGTTESCGERTKDAIEAIEILGNGHSGSLKAEAVWKALRTTSLACVVARLVDRPAAVPHSSRESRSRPAPTSFPRRPPARQRATAREPHLTRLRDPVVESAGRSGPRCSRTTNDAE